MKYFDNNTYATDPLGLTLSVSKLRDLVPEWTGIQGIWYGLTSAFRGKPNLVEVLKEHIRYGDSQPAVVVSVEPLLVAAYSVDIDCVVILRFPSRFVAKYNLKTKSRLVSVNTYTRLKQYQSDLVPGPNRASVWTGIHPIIVDFVSGDTSIIEARRKSIDDKLWNYVYELGVAYVDAYPGVYRDGRPFYAQKVLYDISEMPKVGSVNPPDRLEQLLEQADTYYVRRQWPEAIQVYTRILQIDPLNVPIRVRRGLLVYELGDPERAMQDFEYALRVDPNYGMAYYGRGWVKHRRGDYRGELQDAIRGIRLDPDNAGMYYRRIGSAYHGLEDYDKAIKAYNEAIRLNSDMDEGTIYNRGLCYYDMQEYRLALMDFDRCLELDPDWAWAFSARARTHYQLKNYECAIADYDRVVQLEPNSLRAYLLRGTLQAKIGKRAEAKEGLRRALQLAWSPGQRRLVKRTLRRVNWSPVVETMLRWLGES